jgi:hypothetical protein
MLWQFKGYVVLYNDQGDSDILCEHCIKPADLDAFDCYPTEDQESDSPMHCTQCHRPLEHNLTDDGVQYVIEAVVNQLLDWDLSLIGDILPWYEESPSTEVVKDWAASIRDYVSGEDKELVWYFLDIAP